MKNSLVYILALGVVTGGIFYYVHAQQFSNDNTPPPTKSAEKSEKRFLLKIVERKLTNGTEKLLAIKQGDIVTIEILSDEDEELHLHGYDKTTEVKKDTPSYLTFIADKTGHFVFELEKNKVDLGAFEVYP